MPAREVTIWPRVGLGYQRQQRTSDLASGPNSNAGVLSFDVPLLFHFSKHAFAGLAPRLDHEVAQSFDGGSPSIRATTFGVAFLAGGRL